MSKDCWYMYLDEAGNSDFSPSGSKHFIMTCVITNHPFNHVEPLYGIKCNCLVCGLDEKKHRDAHKFHASEDSQAIRDEVFGVIKENLDSFSIYTVIIRKNKTNPAIQDFKNLYGKVFEWLVGYVFSHEDIEPGDEVVVVTDTLPVQKKENAIKGTLKRMLNTRALKMGIAYRLYHHRSDSDINLQVADYCCWAIQRKWERDDLRSYNIIHDAICGEGDLFEHGKTEYYQY